MKHSSFATLPSLSSDWEAPNSDSPKTPSSSLAARIETLDPEGVAAFASIHKKTLAMDEAAMLRLLSAAI